MELHVCGNIFLRYSQYVFVYSVSGKISAERRILKDTEERSPGLIEALFRHLIGMTRDGRKPQFKTSGVTVKIRSGGAQNIHL
jgi:hypothetical protein